MSILKRMIAMTLLVGVAAFLAGVHTPKASAGVKSAKAKVTAQAAALHPIAPEGLPKNNAPQAWAVYQSRVDYDQALGSALAHATGAVAYNAADYQPVGYSNGAPPGSTNSGVTDSGGLSSAQDTANCNVHSKMLVVMNIHTQAKAYICVNCANPRLFSQSPPAFHPFVKQTVVNYYKQKTASKTTVCPNGTPVTVTVTATIHGKLRMKTWGQIAGVLKLKMQAAFDAQATIKIDIKCGASPTCPCATTPLFFKRWFNAVGGDVTLGKTSESIPFTAYFNGKVYPLTVHPGAQFSIPGVASGDDVMLCEDAAYRGIHNVSLIDPNTGGAAANGCVTYHNVHGMVFIDNREGGVCTSNCAPPPPCTTCTPPPCTTCTPPPANQPPTVSIVHIEHVFSKGHDVLHFRASDPDGDSLIVGCTAQYGRVGGAGPDPNNPSLYTASYDAPVNTGPNDIIETVTCSANDQHGHVVSASDSFRIVPDQF